MTCAVRVTVVTVPDPVTDSVEDPPVALLSGIATGTLVVVRIGQIVAVYKLPGAAATGVHDETGVSGELLLPQVVVVQRLIAVPADGVQSATGTLVVLFGEVQVVAKVRGIGYTQAHELVQRTPVVIVQGVSLARAQELAGALRVGNAVVSLRGATQ